MTFKTTLNDFEPPSEVLHSLIFCFIFNLKTFIAASKLLPYLISCRRLYQKLTELNVIITDVAFLSVVQLTSMTSSVHVTVVKAEMLLETRVALATRERH